MGGIQLPALGLRPPQVPDPLEQLGKIGALKNQQQQGQLQQQSIQEGQLALQQKQRQMQDQQTIMQAAAAHGGSLVDALPELAGKISAQSYIPLQKSIIDTQKSYAEKKKLDLENEVTTGNQLLGLIDQAKQLPPDVYAQKFPEIATQALQIRPDLKGHIDPTKPVPQAALDQFALGVATHTQLATIETQKREQAAQQETVRHNQAMEGQKSTEVATLMKGGKPHSVLVDKKTGEEVKDLGETKSPSTVNNLMTGNDAKDIADAIENGDQPPTLQGLYRNAGPVRAELARRGTPLAKMEMDWKAVQKHIQTLNGPQQLRLQQSITSAGEMLDKIDGLYSEWQNLAPTSGFKVLNKASLAAMKNLPGRPGAVATALDAQIADLTADLGNVYMGGNSPTDHALGLAGKNLSADWNKDTFEEAIKQARANLKIRLNSMKNSGAVGLSGTTNYAPPNEGTTQSAPAQQAAPAAPSATGPNGHKIVVKDGKWVDAQTGAPI